MKAIEQLAELAQPFTRQPYVLRVRRNHGLEHATIHILNQRRYRLSGRSDGGGFTLLGGAPTEEVEAAAREALARMQAGEHNLALHPNCGTNLVTAGWLATAIAYLSFAGAGWRRGWRRFPTVLALVMAAFVFSTPLGMSLQRHFTTEGDPGELELAGVRRETLTLLGRTITLHRVATRQG